MSAVGLNEIIAKLFYTTQASLDEDGMAHYMLDGKSKKPIDISMMETCQVEDITMKVILGVWESQKSVSLSDSIFRLTAFPVEAVYLYRDKDETDYRVAFESPLFAPNFVVLEWYDGDFTVTMGPFDPLEDQPHEVTKYLIK